MKYLKTNLKKRVIPIILFSNYQVVKSKEFKDFRDLHLENIRSIVEEEIGKLYTGLKNKCSNSNYLINK